MEQPNRQSPTSTPAQGASSPAFSVKALLRAVRKHWAIVLVLAAAVAVAATFNTLSQTPIYEATGTIEFDPNPASPLGHDVASVVEMDGGAYWSNQEYYATQYEVITSQMVAKMVVRQLGLQRDPGFISNAGPKEPDAENEAVEPTGEVSVTDAAQILRSRLSVVPVGESRLAAISYQDADPARAQRVLRTLLDAYVQQNVDRMVESTASAGDWLRGQLAKLKGDLEVSERALHDFKLDNNILSVSIDDQGNMLRGEMEKFSSILSDTRASIARTDARLDAITTVQSDPYNLPSTEMLESGALNKLRVAYLEAERSLLALQGSNRGVQHPASRAARANLRITKNALGAEVGNIKGALEGDATALRIQEGTLAELLAEAKKQALELNLMEIDYNRLLRTKDNTEKLYSVILERTKASDITRMLRVNNIRVLDPPLKPTGPISPDVPSDIGLGVFAGLLLGVGAAFAREQLDRSLKTPEDVEAELGLPVLGVLPEVSLNSEPDPGAPKGEAPDEALNRPELIVHDRPASGPAEAARAIRTNVMFMSPDEPYRTFLITSSGPHEGKTTVSCSIAIAMAQAGQTVLILDCDLRRGRLHKVFDKPNDLGLTSTLIDPNLLDDIDMTTEVPGLSVLTAGPTPPNPAELLHSAAFLRLLDELSQRFDRVILDSPPLGPVTDSAVLSTITDATIFVARAFKTRKDTAKRAARILGDVSTRATGCVLNAADLTRPEYRQDYYYYYYREEDEDEETKDIDREEDF